MGALRQAVLEKLARARATVDKLHGEGQGVELTAIEWEKGYIRALEEVLALEGVSLRRHPRRVTSLPAWITRTHGGPGRPQTGQGTILDLSVGGCRLATRVELSVGDTLEISFRLPGDDKVLAPRGRVLRLELLTDTPSAGVEFQELPAEIQEVLRVFCAAPA